MRACGEFVTCPGCNPAFVPTPDSSISPNLTTEVETERWWMLVFLMKKMSELVARKMLFSSIILTSNYLVEREHSQVMSNYLFFAKMMAEYYIVSRHLHFVFLLPHWVKQVELFLPNPDEDNMSGHMFFGFHHFRNPTDSIFSAHHFARL